MAADRWVSIKAHHFLADALSIGASFPIWVPNVKLVADDGSTIIGPSGGLKVEIVSGGGGSGGGLTDAELRASAVPVSLATAPLPAGAATEATLADCEADLDAILAAQTDGTQKTQVTALPAGLATSANQATEIANLASILARQADGTQHAVVDNFPATQPVSAAALPLPAGAAQEHTTAASPHACRLSDGAAFIDPRSIRALTSGDQVTIANASIAVTGTFWQATQPISAAALPLPTGASTEATLSLIKAKTDNLDVALSTRAVTGLTDTQLRASAVPVSGTFFQATQPVSGTFWQATQPVSIAATVAVSAAALPLPAGAATSALQTTGNTSLSSIDGKVPALVGGRTPVDGSGVTQPVSAVSLPLPTGAATGTKQDTGNASCASIDGKITACNTGAVVVSSSALPTGASTSAKQDTGNVSLASIDGHITKANTDAVTITSSVLPTGGSTAARQDTGNTSLASLDGKVTACDTTGKSTAALQTTGNASLGNIEAATAASKTDLDTLVARTPALGAAVKAASWPVNIASDQIVPVSGTVAVSAIAGSVTVVGPAADGATATANPVLVGGVDAQGYVQNLPLHSSNALDEPHDVVVPVRAKRIEDALDTIIQQNAIMIQLLTQVAMYADPMTPAALIQTNPPSPTIGEGTDAQLADPNTPLQ